MIKFLDYIEIKTKAASVLPFFYGLFYCLAAYRTWNLRNTVVFFISMLCLDAATTALNNYMDSKATGRPLSLERKTAKRLLFLLLFAALLGGLLLSAFCGLVVLAAGALCFAVGVLYTFGPVRLSALPFGEAFSGVFMGFFIPFLTVYINAPKNSLIDYRLSRQVFELSFNIPGLWRLLFLSVPPICCIANIMLANNICDVEDDTKIGRFTLPYYLKRKNSLRLFALLYYTAFLSIIILAVFKVLPFYVLAAFVVFPFVQKNISAFMKTQDKSKTFPLSVKNFIFLMLPLIVSAILAYLIRSITNG